MAEQDQRISEAINREHARLRNFIRRRVPDPRDAEDILQDVFYELVEANRLLMPIEHVTGWLFRVARNRITDLFRKKKPESFSDTALTDEDDEQDRASRRIIVSVNGNTLCFWLGSTMIRLIRSSTTLAML
jgi:RNA polymerase sigma factor (sigma-70 family)